ncbi:MAG: isoprenylcysteine carboxylmethyltransferase family protein [Gammaproteobacteria bacterium]|nr:isoprenylcysteine carboxylmethyltransferase family protein [Gammaproteobacteria bacterium]
MTAVDSIYSLAFRSAVITWIQLVRGLIQRDFVYSLAARSVGRFCGSVSFGRGTPAPIDAPKQLVVRGLYRYTRNPMYLGILTIILGWATLFKSFNLVFYAVCVVSCFHLFIIFYEEPHLQKIFGQAYDQYCAKVGRWLPSSVLQALIHSDR